MQLSRARLDISIDQTEEMHAFVMELGYGYAANDAKATTRHNNEVNKLRKKTQLFSSFIVIETNLSGQRGEEG